MLCSFSFWPKYWYPNLKKYIYVPFCKGENTMFGGNNKGDKRLTVSQGLAVRARLRHVVSVAMTPIYLVPMCHQFSFHLFSSNNRPIRFLKNNINNRNPQKKVTEGKSKWLFSVMQGPRRLDFMLGWPSEKAVPAGHHSAVTGLRDSHAHEGGSSFPGGGGSWPLNLGKSNYLTFKCKSAKEAIVLKSECLEE